MTLVAVPHKHRPYLVIQVFPVDWQPYTSRLKVPAWSGAPSRHSSSSICLSLAGHRATSASRAASTDLPLVLARGATGGPCCKAPGMAASTWPGSGVRARCGGPEVWSSQGAWGATGGRRSLGGGVRTGWRPGHGCPQRRPWMRKGEGGTAHREKAQGRREAQAETAGAQVGQLWMEFEGGRAAWMPRGCRVGGPEGGDATPSGAGATRGGQARAEKGA